MAKKNFTSSDEAINKFFTPQRTQDSSNNTSDLNNSTTYDTGNIKPAKNSNNNKRRGKRAKRLVLLLDEKLKEDIVLLSKATGSKSTNDFIIKILLEHLETHDNQTRLEQYKKLLQ